MSVSGVTHHLASTEVQSGRPDGVSAAARHRGEMAPAAAERETQRVKPADQVETPRSRPATSRHVDKTA
jgi:hypothetical protein